MALVALGFALATQARAATISIQVTDAAGEGFNDPTVFKVLDVARQIFNNELISVKGMLVEMGMPAGRGRK